VSPGPGVTGHYEGVPMSLDSRPHVRSIRSQRSKTGRVRGRTSAFATLAALAMVSAFAPPAHAADAYVFTKLVDSAADGFNQNTLGSACPSINSRGDIAFKSESGPAGNATDGIYRANASGGIRPIFEVAPGSGGLLANGNPSMNDSGQVSFGATSPGGVQTIRRGDGTTLTTIAGTSRQRKGFASLGRETSINDTGEVAFDGALGSGASGLFSGSGGTTTTHYLNTQNVSVDGSAARFTATSDRPSINNLGDIAILDQIQGASDPDIFRGQEGSFTTISASNPPESFAAIPLLNNGGTVVWQTRFVESGTGLEGRRIVTGNGVGPDTTVVDSEGAFNIFDSYAINNSGAVAFSATLDDGLGPNIYVGPDPKKDLVIGRGDTLDGGTVVGLRFCEEGLNDSGQLAFIAQIEDPDSDFPRAVVFRATLRR
jgi:hypothetical protein